MKKKAVQEELDELKAQVQLEEQNKIIAARWHDDLSLNKNWEVANEILADDIIMHVPGVPDAKGKEATIESLGIEFPNMKIQHYETIAEGDYVFIRWDVSFDHTDTIMGFPPSGNHISGVGGMDLFLIKDGKIKEFWQNFDQLQLMQKMGVIPIE